MSHNYFYANVPGYVHGRTLIVPPPLFRAVCLIDRKPKERRQITRHINTIQPCNYGAQHDAKIVVLINKINFAA